MALVVKMLGELRDVQRVPSDPVEIGDNLQAGRDGPEVGGHGRMEGYNIQAQPHLGYRLVGIPDKMLPEEVTWKLGTKIIGKKVYSYQSTSSTMDIANQLANSDAQEGTCVFAEQQTKGRGRLGREWISPKGKGIYLSVILRPKILPQEAPKITLMAAVSVARQAVRPQMLSPTMPPALTGSRSGSME